MALTVRECGGIDCGMYLLFILLLRQLSRRVDLKCFFIKGFSVIIFINNTFI